jgi:beta-lactamase regulating signal transducer with metallopeptidase domain
MLSEGWINTLWELHTGFTIGLLTVLLLRNPWRRFAGSQAAYALWLLPPALALAALLPSSVGPPMLTLPTLAVPPPVAIYALVGGPPSTSSGNWQASWLDLWLAGIVAVALVQAARHCGYQRQLLGRHHTYWLAPSGHSPGLLGVWRPRLVLPVDFRQRFGADERRWIVAHEAVHARHFDNPTRLLATVLAGLAWFNPLAWIALGLLRHDQELACDAAVMKRFPGSWRRYGLAMLKLDDAASVPLTASSWRSNHPLKQRITLLKNAAPNVGTRQAARLALALCAVMGVSGVQALNDAIVIVPAPKIYRTGLSDLTPLGMRRKLLEACPQMPLPVRTPYNGLSKGQHLVDVQFKIGRDGRAEAVKVFANPLLGEWGQKTIEAYGCRPELAGTELEQQFELIID